MSGLALFIWGITIAIVALVIVPVALSLFCLLYTSPSPRDKRQARMPSSA